MPLIATLNTPFVPGRPSHAMRSVLALSVAGLIALGGCENPRADSAAAAQQSLVGLPKSVLMQCAGAPTHSATADGLEVMTYETVKLRPDMSTFGFGARWPGRWGYGPGWGFAGGWHDGGGTESRSCRASFTIKDGKVSNVIYGSADSIGTSRLDQCYTVIENCLPPGAK